MTALEQHVAAYLAVRRGLGFKLESEQPMLRSFAAFMDDAGASTITVDLALRWATMPDGVGHAYLAQRMRAVRGFARYLPGIDPATEIPPLELLPARKHRPTPHIYSDSEVAALMSTARALRPPLRAATMETLIGLLASTGLRDNLNGDDVAAKLPLLSTYLGHVDPAATYWYLSAVPELLGLAAERLEQHDVGDDPAGREVALLLREQERVRHWRAARSRRAGR